VHKILRLRRGNSAVTSTFVGKAGEVTIDTTNNVLVVHDGFTPGGWPQGGGGNVSIPIASSTVLGGIKIGTGLNIDGNGVVTVNTASIGNLSITDQTINGTVVNGNIVLAPNGTGRVLLSNLAYPNTDGSAGQTLITDGNGNLYWSTPSSVTFGATAPATPHNGDIWVDSNTGIEYIYYVDQDSGQWVEFGPTNTQNDNINFLALNTSIIPASDSFYNLGSSSKQWHSLYVSGNTIYVNNVPLTIDNSNNLLVNGNVIGGVSTGNISFINDTIYDIYGVTVNNSDLSHGATAGMIVPQNTGGDITLLNYYGNLVISTSTTGSSGVKTWKFQNSTLVNPENVTWSGADIIAGPNTGYIELGSYDQNNWVGADGTGVFLQTAFTTNNYVWYAGIDGNFAPGLDAQQNLGSPSKRIGHIYASGSSVYLDNIKLSVENNQLKVEQVNTIGGNTVISQVALKAVDVSETVPDFMQGGLWYNSTDGRLYVGDNNTWVDAAPVTIPPVSTYLDKLAVDGELIYNTDTTDNTVNLVSPGQRGGFNPGYTFNDNVSLCLQYSHLYLDKVGTWNLGSNHWGTEIFSYSNDSMSPPTNIAIITADGDEQWHFKNDGTLNLPSVINFGQNNSRLNPPANDGSTDLIRLWDFNGSNPSGYNYAIGVEPDHVWFSMDVVDDLGGFKFYSQNNQILKIGGAGAVHLTGNLYFADGSVQSTGYPVKTANTAPSNTHILWFNETDGRLYVHYDNQWVDASPQVPQVLSSLDNNNFSLTLNSDGTITFPDGSVQTGAFSGYAWKGPWQSGPVNYITDKDVVTYAGGAYLKISGSGNSGSSPNVDAIRWQPVVIGIPSGGSTGQVLAKIDNSDYNVEWANQTGGGSFSGNIAGNQITFDQSRVHTPDAGSAGIYDRITLYPLGSNSYGVGIESSYLWLNTGDGGLGVKFYNQGNLAYDFEPHGVIIDGVEDDSTAVIDFFKAAQNNHKVTLASDWTLKIKARADGTNQGHLYLEAGQNTKVVVNGSGSTINLVASDGNTNISTWTFNKTGILQLPGNSELRPNGSGIDLRAGSGGYAQLQNANANVLIGVDDTSTYIQTYDDAHGSKTWTFAKSGSFSLPNNSNINDIPDNGSTPGGIILNVNSNETKFDTGGRTHFPNDLIINYGGISFPDSTYQSTAWQGSLALSNLTDVNITGTPSNGQVLKYNAGLGHWAPASDLTGGGGGGGINLTDLSVTVSNTPSGSGNLSYDSGTGIFTFTQPDLSSFITAGDLSSYPTTANVNSAINAASIAAQSAIDTVSNAVSAVSVAAANATSIANAASAAVNVVSNAVSIVSVAAANATSIANAASNAVSIEIINRQSASAVLESHINTVSNAVSIVSVAAANATSIANAASAAVNVVSNALSSEILNRISADNALSANINTVSNAVSIVSVAAANATSIANAASAAVNVVSNALSAEIVNRVSADNAVSAAALSALNTLSAAVAGQGYLKSNSLSVTTNAASGGGSLSYASNVFTFTPPSNLTNGIYTASLGNTGNLTVSNDIITTGGNLRTTATTAYLFNATPTTVFIAGNASVGTTIGHASGTVTINGNLQASTNGFTIGYKDIPQLSYTGNTTLAATDGGKHYYSTVATATTLTVPNSSSVSFAVGTAVNVVNQGAGTITLAQGSGVTLYLAGNSTAGNRSLSSYGVATIQKVATDTWFVVGVGLA
jgi:hypothetical protein